MLMRFDGRTAIVAGASAGHRAGHHPLAGECGARVFASTCLSTAAIATGQANILRDRINLSRHRSHRQHRPARPNGAARVRVGKMHTDPTELTS
jgi:hypothetical protein